MQELLTGWGRAYFTEPILIIILFITLIVAIKENRRSKMLTPLPFYIISLILVFISGAASTLSKYANYHYALFSGLATYIDYIFTSIEMIIFSSFFYKLLDNRIIKKFIIVSNVLFCFYFIYMLVKDPEFYKEISEITQSKVYTVEGIILLIICLFYFIELFKKIPYQSLNREPVFWISAGLLFFLACTLPFSLLEVYIQTKLPDQISTSYSIFYVFYILFSLMIIKAYLCKPEKMT